MRLYYLKSYHYGYHPIIGNVQRSTHNVVRVRDILNRHPTSDRKFSFVNNFYLSGFKFDYYYAITNLSNFPLYFELYNKLIYKLSKLPIGKEEQDLSDFTSQCGDTLLTKNLKKYNNGRLSIAKRKKLPFKTLLTENNQEINIIPSKGKYGLLFLYFYNKREGFENLVDSLPSYIQPVSYRLNNNGYKQTESINKSLSLDENKKLKLYASPTVNYFFKNILITAGNPIIILYDDAGEILYSSLFIKKVKYKKDKSYLNKYITNITRIVQEKKEERSKKKKKLSAIVIFSIITTLLLVLLIYRIRIKRLKRRNEQERMMQQLKLSSVQSQLNPHFLFNALNSIQNLINSNNTKKANRYLIDFSNLLRGVLKNADRPLVPLTDEINLIERYCDLERLRLDFDCTITVNTNFPAELIEVPYMLLQPLVENAIKHGLAKNEKKGELRIDISESDSILYIRIIDNGQGFEYREPENLIAKGKGLKITIDKLKSIYNDNAELTIPENSEGTGGIVQIKLKIG